MVGVSSVAASKQRMHTGYARVRKLLVLLVIALGTDCGRSGYGLAAV